MLAPNGAGVNAGHGVDLTLRNLTKAYLIGADLSSAAAYSVNLADADLSQANLVLARLGAYPSDPNASGPWGGAI